MSGDCKQQPVIFYSNDNQKKQADLSLIFAGDELNKPSQEIKVEIKPAKKFWPAEEYHQDFARKNKVKYNFYRYSCGRDLRLDKVWSEKARKNAQWTKAK